MKPKILSQNVRGLNENDKKLRFKSLFRDWKADIVCLQETKLFVSRAVVGSLWGFPYGDWCLVLFGVEELPEGFC